MANAYFDLSGKKALITGGSRGLGKSIATALGSAGAQLILAGRTSTRLEEVHQEFIDAGVACTVLQTDVCKIDEVQKLGQIIKNEFGGVDILVNAAGINIRGSIFDITLNDWEQVINTNLRGTFFVSQTIAQLMLAQGHGKIINLASLTSYIGLPNMGPYCASKGGVSQITKAMATEWAPYIQANAIAPGYFPTDMTKSVFEDSERKRIILERIPSGRTGIPEDLHGAAIFLASNASDYVTGQVIAIDGGWLAS